MSRILAAFALCLFAFVFAAPAAQAGHCHDPCRERCRPADCCREKVCWPVYRYETRRVFAGYRYDCDGCRHPVYRYERVRVHAGKRCEWRHTAHRRRDPYREPVYTQPAQPDYPAYDYTGGTHAFPNYEGDQ
jgi:hypothetical protein